MESLLFFPRATRNVQFHWLEEKKEDMTLAKSDVNLTFGQWKVFFFSYEPLEMRISTDLKEKKKT